MKVYDILKSAEEIYVEEIMKRSNEANPGMCWCLKVAATKNMDFKEKNRKGHPTYKDLVTNIPEFTPEFLKATKPIKTAGLDFWWDLKDKQSRMNAFHILRSIYKQSDKEFIY